MNPLNKFYPSIQLYQHRTIFFRKTFKFFINDVAVFKRLHCLAVLKIFTLMGLFWWKYKMFELSIYRGVMFNGTEDWRTIWRKTNSAFKNDMTNLANFHKLKNSDFTLESKMAELIQNKMSKQQDRPDAVWKLYFTWEINK